MTVLVFKLLLVPVMFSIGHVTAGFKRLCVWHQPEDWRERSSPNDYMECLGGVAVRSSDFPSSGRGLDFWPGRNQVT